jgi:hypothetical protein
LTFPNVTQQWPEWLQLDEATITEPAEAGELAGRLAREWRFARAAVLDWLARR